MVPTFALYALPPLPRRGAASDDLPAADGDFAAVMAAMGPEAPSPDPTAALSLTSDVALVVPAIVPPQMAEGAGDVPTPKADSLADSAWPDSRADHLATEVLSAVFIAPVFLAHTTSGHILAAPSGRVSPPVPSDEDGLPLEAVVPSETTMAQERATLPVEPMTLTPAQRDVSESGAKSAAWAGPVALVDLGAHGSAPASLPELASRAALAPMPVTGLATELPHAMAAPSLPKSAQVVADGLLPIAAFSAHPFAVASVNPVADATMPKAPAPMAESPVLLMQRAPSSEVNVGLRGPETALPADPIAMASPHPKQQTAPQFLPMQEGATLLTAAVSAPPQMVSAENLPPARTGQTPLPTQAETASPPESPQQTATPIPAVSLGATTQGFMSPNPYIGLGQARRMASDNRDTATESYARPTEPTVTAIPPNTGADIQRQAAADPVDLGRPTLPSSTNETRAILRQLTPNAPDQDGSVEISLFPKGLGQVKLDIQHGPDGARIIVSADRPETLDLIRRHSADLVAEFRAAGMANPVVSFAPIDAGQTAQPSGRMDATGLLAGSGFGGSSQHAGGSSHGQPAPRHDNPLGTQQPDVTPSPYRSDAVPHGGLILRL